MNANEREYLDGLVERVVAVGMYYADLVVEDNLVVELKCANSLCDQHLAQCLNYIRATGLHLALLVNFQNPRVQWRRVVRDF